MKKQEVPFGDPRIQSSMRLPEAFRRLARPSSVLKPNHPPGSFTDCTIHFVDLQYRLHRFYQPLPFPLKAILKGAYNARIHPIALGHINIL